MDDLRVWRPGMSLADYAAAWKDMEPHWGQLMGLAMKCRHGTIVEFGVRGGVSTWAFLKGLGEKGVLHSVDIDPTVVMQVPPEVSSDPRWHIRFDDSLNFVPPDDTDLLFIDTSHTYKQTKAELLIGIGRGIETIVLHDYLDPDYPGVHEAVHEVLRSTRDYELTVAPSRWGLAILRLNGI